MIAVNPDKLTAYNAEWLWLQLQMSTQSSSGGWYTATGVHENVIALREYCNADTSLSGNFQRHGAAVNLLNEVALSYLDTKHADTLKSQRVALAQTHFTEVLTKYFPHYTLPPVNVLFVMARITDEYVAMFEDNSAKFRLVYESLVKYARQVSKDDDPELYWTLELLEEMQEIAF